MRILFEKNKDEKIDRQELKNRAINTNNRDIIIGINEPAMRKADKNDKKNTLSSLLCPRILSYFIPAVQIAQKQTKAPRLLVMSGIHAAWAYNAEDENEKKIQKINNILKIDFISWIIKKVKPNAFSVIENHTASDFLQMSDEALISFWSRIEAQNYQEMQEVRQNLAKFVRPKMFSKDFKDTEAREAFVRSWDEDMLRAIRYAVIHLFAFGDLNILPTNAIHNPTGYLSIGGRHEEIFNKVRKYGSEIAKQMDYKLFGLDLLPKNNLRLVIESENNAPVPYNGAWKTRRGKTEYDEVTYENERDFSYYDDRKNLQPDMEYIYAHFCDQKTLEKLWDEYKPRYFDLKNRYQKAYWID